MVDQNAIVQRYNKRVGFVFCNNRQPKIISRQKLKFSEPAKRPSFSSPFPTLFPSPRLLTTLRSLFFLLHSSLYSSRDFVPMRVHDVLATILWFFLCSLNAWNLSLFKLHRQFFAALLRLFSERMTYKLAKLPNLRDLFLFLETSYFKLFQKRTAAFFFLINNKAYFFIEMCKRENKFEGKKI